MKRKYCCDESRDMYTDYYVKQSGSGFSPFAGSRMQRGHGLGSLLSGLFRSAMPLLRKGLSWFGRKALDTGATLAGNVARDVAEGKSFKEAAKSRVIDTINEFVPGAIPQTGSGRRRKRNKNLNNSSSSRKRKSNRRKKSNSKRSKRAKRDVLD